MNSFGRKSVWTIFLVFLCRLFKFHSWPSQQCEKFKGVWAVAIRHLVFFIPFGLFMYAAVTYLAPSPPGPNVGGPHVLKYMNLPVKINWMIIRCVQDLFSLFLLRHLPHAFRVLICGLPFRFGYLGFCVFRCIHFGGFIFKWFIDNRIKQLEDIKCKHK